MNLGSLRRRHGDVAGSLKAFAEAACREPTLFDAFFNLAELHLHSGQIEAALENGKKALKAFNRATQGRLKPI